MNAQTSILDYPLHLFTDLLDAVAEKNPRYFSSLDLKSGYFQVALETNTAEDTEFQTCDGSSIFKRIPFGLCDAPIVFQSLIDRVVSDLTPSTCLVYLDDLCHGERHQ